ncbi:MAG: M48 family metalloprotease, partial [Candidatus Omnitrophica bacterium]|nr:M48 family metalloprotease [Candidatus Omnitrophota bacterium]
TGRDPQHACVCVTKGIMTLLQEYELKGVHAHELAHVQNRDTLIMTVTAAIAGAIMMLADMARWGAMFGGSRDDRRDSGNVIALIVLSILAPLAAIIIQLAISRSREYGADARGAFIAHSKLGLISALQKLETAGPRYQLNANPQTAHLFIVNPFRGSFIANLFSTHPPIKDRVEKLKALTI